MKQYEKEGLTRNEYLNIHKWIAYNYGKASCCENEACERDSNTFQYALKKGSCYERKRENFITLCAKCHIRYDLTPDKLDFLKSHPWTELRKDKIRKSRIGKRASDESRLKMSISRLGERNHMYGVSIKGSDHHFFGKTHSQVSKEKIREAHATLSKDDVEFIRVMNSRGIDQRSLCRMFRLAPATINKLIKRKTYTTW